jgi:Aromatic-ring-opening dioxygenase LigAB, LigA subunit
MSLYALQKLIRDVNRKPACREAFFQSAEQFAQSYELTEPERRALVTRDMTALYALGVHGLLLRPFTLLHKMPEPDYLKAIRSEPEGNAR